MQRLLRRGAARLSSCALVVVALSGCGRNSEQSENVAEDLGAPQPGGTVVIAMGQEPDTLMPYAHRSAASSRVLGFMFRMLAETEENFLDFSPSLATSWEFSDDRKTLTMHLRDDVRWTDGMPVTAEDVQFTWEVSRDSLVAYSSRNWKMHVTGCEVVDSHTVRFSFEEVFRDQFRYAKEGFILPKHLLHGVPREQWASAEFGRHPIGCGPFKLESWERGQRMVLVRNEDYFIAEQPYLERVVLQFISDSTVRLQQLRAGLVDVVTDLEPRDAAALRTEAEAGTAAVRVLSARGRFYDYIGYNRRDPLFGSRKVREALTRAIDRQAIIDGLCYGFAEIFESPVLPILWAYNDDQPITPYDPEGAKRLLHEEGWNDSDGDGWLDRDGETFEFTVITNKDNQLRVSALVPVQQYWRQVGVKANIQTIESQSGRELRAQRRFQAYYGGWSSSITVDLENIWGCKNMHSNFNYVEHCNPVVDSLNALGVSTMDPEKAKPFFHEAQRLVAQDYPYTWMYYIHSIIGINRRLQALAFDARGPYLNMEEWWIPASMQTQSTQP